MSNDPARPGAGADDLLGRWFAHHERTAEDEAARADGAAQGSPDGDGSAQPPRHTPLAARLSEAAAATPRMTRPSASAVLAGDPHSGLGGVLPPSTFGVRDADREVRELDRQPPEGFEPVILRSVRKKTEAKEQEPEPKGRLSRLKSRLVGPVDDEEQPSDESAGPVELPPAAPAPPPPGSLEDVIARATQPSHPLVEADPEPVLPGPDTEPAPVVPAPEPEPEPELPGPELPGPDTEPAPVVPEPEPVLPGPDTEPAPVVPAPEPEPEPEPVLPGPDTEPAPVGGSAKTKRRLVARTKASDATGPGERRRLAAPTARPSSPPATGTGGAARGLLAAARAATPAPAPGTRLRLNSAQQEVESVAVPLPVPAPALVPAPEPTEAEEAPTPSAQPAEMPAIYQFAPMKSARRFLSLMLLTGLVASGYLGYHAYESRESIDIGIAAIVTLATLVIWAIRAGASVTRLTVRRGQLEITRQGGRMVFDLASTYTEIEVLGRPGSKKWKVLFHRRGMSPAVVDSSMVDPRDFMRVLRFYRSDLRQSSS